VISSIPVQRATVAIPAINRNSWQP